MSFRFAFQKEQRLLVVVFEGSISPEEEREALIAVSSDPAFDPDAPVLVDRRRATMSVGPKDVPAQIDLARERYQPTGKPPMALVVVNDYDFGMARMLELTADEEAPHELRVFRSLESACEWLGVDPSTIVWP